MKKMNKEKILLIIFIVLFSLSILGDILIISDYFNPCRIDMDSCSQSLLYEFVHGKIFLKILGIENILNIIFSTIIIYKSFLKKKYALFTLGIVSLTTTLSLWLLMFGEIKILFR